MLINRCIEEYLKRTHQLDIGIEVFFSILITKKKVSI
jgi:hypothetical protein